MKKERILELIPQILVPGLITILGLILMANPDSATVLVSSIIGWALILIGAEKAIGKLRGRKVYGGWLLTFVCCFLGLFIVIQPLALAQILGRAVGIVLIIRGVGDLKDATMAKEAGRPYKRAQILALVTAGIGFILAALPLTLTRTVLRLCGLVVAAIGTVNILEKLQGKKQIDAGDPNIIDADE